MEGEGEGEADHAESEPALDESQADGGGEHDEREQGPAPQIAVGHRLSSPGPRIAGGTAGPESLGRLVGEPPKRIPTGVTSRTAIATGRKEQTNPCRTRRTATPTTRQRR